MLTLAVVYTFVAGRDAEIVAHVRALIAASRQEPGCRTYDVNRSQDDPRTFLFYERYDDEAALDAHRATPHFLEHGKNGLQTMVERRDAALYVPFP